MMAMASRAEADLVRAPSLATDSAKMTGYMTDMKNLETTSAATPGPRPSPWRTGRAGR